jgi:hypothetical protein
MYESYLSQLVLRAVTLIWGKGEQSGRGGLRMPKV